MGPIPPFSAGPQFETHVSLSTVPGSSATFPIASASPSLHFGLGGTFSSPDTGYAGTTASLSLAPDLVEATVASWSDSLLILAVLVDSLHVGNDFRLAAHSSPLVRFLLMDDKGGEIWRIKAYLVYICVPC
jgi:hypothetical protein